MRVCHVIHGLAPGGAEQLLVELAIAGPSAGLDVTVVSLMPLTGRRYASELLSLGVTVESLNLPSRWDPRGMVRAERVIKRLRPQVIHTHLKHADLVGAYAARRLGVPMVSTLHRIEDAETGVGRLKRWLGGQARMRVAARTITVSAAQRAWYLSAFRADPQKVVTIHNGVRSPAELTAPDRARLRHELGLEPTDIAATMLGVMRPGKGHEQLIGAARLIPEDSPLRFVAVGDGPLRDSLERSAQEAGVAGTRVLFPGWRSDVSDILASSELVVHPTLFDALPTALIYGLASGIPAVASDVGGVPEIVTPDTGILVPAGDVPALASAVVELAGDPDRRAAAGLAARRRFEEEFAAEVWVGRLRELYEDVIKE